MPHTLAQLEAFVSSPHYDADTADLIARGIPALKASGAPGELISPGVRRIHGNLCNVHGRYGPCDAAASGKKPPKGRMRKPAKPKVDRAAQHAQNRTATLTGQGYSTDDQAALSTLHSGAQPAKVSQALIDKGLVEQAQDGAYRMTASGRALIGAADQGNAGRARDTASGAADRLSTRRARQAEQAKRQQDAAGKRVAGQIGRELTRRQRAEAAAKRQAAKKPAKTSTGGRKQPEKTPVEKPLKPAKRIARSQAPAAPALSNSSAPKPAPAKAPATQIAPALQEAATALSQGDDVSDEQIMSLVRNGLVKLNKDGEPVLTAAGLRATMKAQSDQDKAMFASMGGGSGGGSGGGGSGGGKGSGGAWKRGPDGKRTPPYSATIDRGRAALQRKNNKDDNDLRSALSSASSAHDKIHQISGHLASGEMAGRKLGPMDRRNLEAQVARYRKQEAVAIRRVHDLSREPAATKSFRVFKDAQGRHRWVAQSSTAFQDRDREIVSTKALEDDCQWADTHDNAYGPLRWWHTPGLDLGDCDFNAMHGRVLIESGTFRSATIAQKVAAAAPGLEISLGFIHLPTEPDANGVFHHIRRFERSLVPRGKASNRFTAFTVKETPRMDATKIAALKTLGFGDDEIAALQAQAAATEKAATEQGVAFKSDEPTPPEEITIGGVVYTVKAFPVADAPPDTAAEDAMDGGADDAMEAPMDENALTLSAGDLAAIGEAISAGIAQVMGALDLEKKVAGHVQGLMAPYQATKDAEAAQTKEQLQALATATKALDARVAELTGDQPAAQYRPSQANNNVLTDAAMLAAAKQALDPNAADPWADIKLGLGLTRPQ